MLPPQLHVSLRRGSMASSAIVVRSSSRSSVDPFLRTNPISSQSRSFWWRRPRDYCARDIDPLYHRFTRYRTLKTRAKLLDKLRRRGRWDWDFNQRPFFSPRQIRQASHIGRPKWRADDNVGDKKKNSDGEQTMDDDGFELNQREKEWKDQMEAMRKRIDQDPYEAVFGKRFEPFWSPLVPAWMRAEMGFDRWPKARESSKTSASLQSSLRQSFSRSNANEVNPVEPREQKMPKDTVETEADIPNGQLTSYSYSSRKPPLNGESESPNGQLTNYSYASSTSWDSWTKKTRKEEWDSISGETRRYEYDPISNRMVPVAASLTTKPSEALALEALNQNLKSLTDSSRTNNSGSSQPSADTSSKPINTPRKSSSEPREATSSPTHTVEVTTKDKPSAYFPSLLRTSLVAHPARPAALAKIQENNLDLLTAADIRASVRKAKESFKGDENRALNSQDQGQFEKQHKELPKLREQLLAAKQQLANLDSIEADQSETKMSETKSRLQSASEPRDTKPVLQQSEQSLPLSALQPSLDRMQSKAALDYAALESADPDDSAAHESTGDRVDYAVANISSQWGNQVDLLQSDRIRRTRGVLADHAPAIDSWTIEERTQLDRLRQVHSTDKPRWIDVMHARKARYDAQRAEIKAEAKLRSSIEDAKVERAQSFLEAEIEQQKLRMQAYENRHAEQRDSLDKLRADAPEAKSVTAVADSERERYRRKIQDLRNELDNAFRQSSVNAEMQLERIMALEQALAVSRTADHSANPSEKDRYVEKIKNLKEELNDAFRQSNMNAEMHVDRIRKLEEGLRKAQTVNASSSKGAETTQAEGDFCASVTKYAKNSSKWYKKPCNNAEITGISAEAKILDPQRSIPEEELVREVKDIYEERYGKIDVDHRQSDGMRSSVSTREQIGQAVESEFDVNLDKALANYDNDKSYKFEQDSFGAEMTSRGKEAHETQALKVPEPSTNFEQVTLKNLLVDSVARGEQIVDRTPQNMVDAELANSDAAESNNAKTAQNEWNIQWEEPPVYKVLAYDSGHDMFSTAVTSSNFTGKETPISIPEALSQLYQPARFVPHFSELQKEGFQVVHGTKDLLVFKKVKSVSETKSTNEQSSSTLEDHGMFRPNEKATGTLESRPAGVNPIDGTSYPVEPNTSAYASPTGFVGDAWDYIAPSGGKSRSLNIDSKPKVSSATLRSPHENYSQPADEATEEAEVKHFPRVKREERVYSGSRLLHKQRRHQRRQHHETTEEVKRSNRLQFRWGAVAGLGVCAVAAYSVGAAVERKEKRDAERWQQILEGKRGRWE